MRWEDLLNLVIGKLPFIPFATTVISGFVLKYWTESSTWLGLDQHRQWVGVVFLVSAVICLAQIAKLLSDKIKERLGKDAQLERLQSLTAVEADVLRQFVNNKIRTRDFEEWNPTVLALKNANVLTQVSEASYQTGQATFLISESAWICLTKNQNLLDQ